MRIDAIQPGLPVGRPDLHAKTVPDSSVPSFKETLAEFLKDVNGTQSAASEAQKKLLSGEVTDVHQVISKSEEANVAFNMLMELRNKALDGLQEAMRLRL